MTLVLISSPHRTCEIEWYYSETSLT
jgi:hypothetical protein